MDAFSVLPPDLIVDILILLPDRSTLHNAIHVSKSIRNAFNGRRSLVLGRVFERELFCTFETLVREDLDTLLVLTNSRYRNIDSIRRFETLCQKLTQRPHDALTLSLCAWRFMRRCRIRVGFRLGFAERLMDLCEATRTHAISFSVAEDTWRWILATAESYGTNWLYHGSVSQPADEIIKRLVNMLLSKGRVSNATQVLFEYLEVRDFKVHTCLLRIILTLIKLGPESTFTIKFIEALKLRVAQSSEREASISFRNLVRHYLPPQSCLNITYLELNRIEQSIALLHDEIQMLQLPRETLAILAMSRRVVRSLKHSNRGQALMLVRQSVLDRLYASNFLRSNAPICTAWAKDYAADARLFGLPEIAVNVEEQLWRRLNSLADTSSNSQMIHRANLALRALLKSYAEAGMTDKLENLPQERKDSSCADREAAHRGHYLKANMNVPIMT